MASKIRYREQPINITNVRHENDIKVKSVWFILNKRVTMHHFHYYISQESHVDHTDHKNRGFRSRAFMPGVMSEQCGSPATATQPQHLRLCIKSMHPTDW